MIQAVILFPAGDQTRASCAQMCCGCIFVGAVTGAPLVGWKQQDHVLTAVQATVCIINLTSLSHLRLFIGCVVFAQGRSKSCTVSVKVTDPDVVETFIQAFLYAEMEAVYTLNVSIQENFVTTRQVCT